MPLWQLKHAADAGPTGFSQPRGSTTSLIKPAGSGSRCELLTWQPSQRCRKPG